MTVKIRKYIPLIPSLLLCTCLGCTTARVSLPAFTHTFARGEYASAEKLARGEIGLRNTRRDLLWNLQAGTAARLTKDYTKSNAYFEHAEDVFRNQDLQSAAGKAAQASQGFALNDSFMPYAGKMLDRVMVNTYKALNYAALGDMKRARVEFNRALYRQNAAKRFFGDQAAKIKPAPGGNEKVSATLNNPELERIINERYKALNNFKVYSRFLNPFTTYIAGLFFWLVGDLPKAADILKEAYALNSDNAIVTADLARVIENDLPSRELWIVYENGLAPSRQAARIDIPLFLENPRAPVKYIGLALPELTLGQEAYPYVSVEVDGAEEVRTQTLANLSDSIAAEFREELPMTLTREVSRAALKGYLQYKLRDEFGDLAGAAGGVYQALTTAVDTRTWTALPQDFQVAHMPIPDDNTVTIRLPGDDMDDGTDGSIPIIIPRDCENVILYIRITARGAAPAVDLITFKKENKS